jgi:hypothetical protein
MMTNQEINIAIAEACGIISRDDCGPLYKTDEGWIRNCPDYCHDLNAMHEAEMSLPETSFLDWVQEMETMFYGPEWRMNLYRATARQRAEDFLRTIGKWND